MDQTHVKLHILYHIARAMRYESIKLLLLTILLAGSTLRSMPRGVLETIITVEIIDDTHSSTCHYDYHLDCASGHRSQFTFTIAMISDSSLKITDFPLLCGTRCIASHASDPNSDVKMQSMSQSWMCSAKSTA
ncbi:hypothetical protein B0F90DRAFT_1214844 [Multifurca ochricompacta]|uniref:Uncharacterized protein n=1 Tax=Multifurca ochricompacta TaxID=376703 RepID=A0AAD4QHX5_9AGAM|nr:hypothetical protein B0F90DRAFT_1214844 [Multifurca ochricompacta]